MKYILLAESHALYIKEALSTTANALPYLVRRFPGVLVIERGQNSESVLEGETGFAIHYTIRKLSLRDLNMQAPMRNFARYEDI